MPKTVYVELRGDKTEAKRLSLAHSERLLLNFRRNTSFQNLKINANTTNFFDALGRAVGTIYMQVVHGAENIIVTVPPVVIPKPEKELWLPEQEIIERIVPVIMTYDEGSDFPSGFVVCESGTFEGPYRWVPNTEELTYDALADDENGEERESSIKDNTLLAVISDDTMLYYLDPTGAFPSDSSSDFDDWADYSETIEQVCQHTTAPYGVQSIDDIPPSNLCDYPNVVNCVYSDYTMDESGTDQAIIKAWGERMNIEGYSVTQDVQGYGKIRWERWGVGQGDYDLRDEWGVPYPPDDCDEEAWFAANDAALAITIDNYTPITADPCNNHTEVHNTGSKQERSPDFGRYNESVRIQRDNVNAFSAAYRVLWKDSTVVYDKEAPCFGVDPDPVDETSVYEHYEFYLNVDGTEHSIATWTQEDDTYGYIEGYDNIKYYGSESSAGVTGLLAVCHMSKSPGYDYTEFLYTYVGGNTDMQAATARFATDPADEGNYFRHKIPDVRGMDYENEPVFDGKVFLAKLRTITRKEVKVF